MYDPLFGSNSFFTDLFAGAAVPTLSMLVPEPAAVRPALSARLVRVSMAGRVEGVALRPSPTGFSTGSLRSRFTAAAAASLAAACRSAAAFSAAARSAAAAFCSSTCRAASSSFLSRSSSFCMFRSACCLWKSSVERIAPTPGTAEVDTEPPCESWLVDPFASNRWDSYSSLLVRTALGLNLYRCGCGAAAGCFGGSVAEEPGEAGLVEEGGWEGGWEVSSPSAAAADRGLLLVAADCCGSRGDETDGEREPSDSAPAAPAVAAELVRERLTTVPSVRLKEFGSGLYTLPWLRYDSVPR